MLARAGVCAPGQIETARAHAAQAGCGLVEALVATGAIAEDALAAFLQSRLLVPEVAANLFAQVPREITDRLDPALAHRLGAYPVSVDEDGNLTVALVDPTDGSIVDEIAAVTGHYVIRAVAPASTIRAALAERYGPPPAAPAPGPAAGAGTPPPAAPPATPQAPVPASPEVPGASSPGASPAPQPPTAGTPHVGPTQDATAPRVDEPDAASTAAPRQRAAVPAAAAGGATGPRPAAWEPPLPANDDEPDPLSAAAFGRVLPRIVAAQTREDITRIVLDFLGAGFRRVILFVHAHGELRGREGRGDDLDLEAVRLVRIPAAEPSVFSKVITSKRPYFGPLRPDTPVDRAFSEAFGGLVGNVLVLPVLLRDKVPVLIFASGTTHPVDPRSIQDLADGVSAAIERIILRQKAAR